MSPVASTTFQLNVFPPTSTDVVTPRCFKVEGRYVLYARTGVPEHVRETLVPAGKLMGQGWILCRPLLYTLENAEEGVIAGVSELDAYGYGENEMLAVQSLLDGMIDTLQSLEGTPAQAMDDSALELRAQLRSRLGRSG